MKGIYGLLAALALGAAGAMLNWSYLRQRSLDIEMVAFLGINKDDVPQAAQRYEERHLVKVEIPKNRVGNLEFMAYKWDDKNLVIGMNVVRQHEAGDLVLRQDTRMPPPEPRKLDENERRIPIPVDTRSFVPSLYRAGDMVTFVVPRFRRSSLSGGTPEAADAVATETIGPFEIHTVGDRTASIQVARGSRKSTSQPNVLGIVVRMEAGELEPKARKLVELLVVKGVRQVVVIAHPRAEE